MLYDIEICHRPQKCNTKDGRIADIITDAYAIGTDKFVVKESVFRVLGSNEELLMSGRVWNNSFLIILDNTPFLNSTTYFMMYLRKAPEDHLTAW